MTTTADLYELQEEIANAAEDILDERMTAGNPFSEGLSDWSFAEARQRLIGIRTDWLKAYDEGFQFFQIDMWAHPTDNPYSPTSQDPTDPNTVRSEAWEAGRLAAVRFADYMSGKRDSY